MSEGGDSFGTSSSESSHGLLTGSDEQLENMSKPATTPITVVFRPVAEHNRAIRTNLRIISTTAFRRYSALQPSPVIRQILSVCQMFRFRSGTTLGGEQA